MAPEVPSGPGGAPQPQLSGCPTGIGSCQRGQGHRGRQPGSPDVSTLRRRAADALTDPRRRLVLKGQCRVQARGGGASCPCTRPLPRGNAPPRRPAAGRPPPPGGAQLERGARGLGMAADGCLEARFFSGRAVASGAARPGGSGL